MVFDALLGKTLTNKRGIDFDLCSFESTDVYADAWLSKRMVLLMPVWPFLLNLEIFTGSGLSSAEIKMQTEDEMTQQVSLIGINTDSNANNLDLQVLGRS